jgi:hypothetical protein
MSSASAASEEALDVEHPSFFRMQWARTGDDVQFRTSQTEYRAREEVPDGAGGESAAAGSVAEAIKHQDEQYWPDGIPKLFLLLLDWALARQPLGKLPAAQEQLTSGMLAQTF